MPWYYDWSSLVFPQSLQKRLFGFLLQKGIGQFLENDLDSDRLNLQLGNGVAELHNVAIKVEALNNALVGLPFCVQDGYIGRVRVKIPWKNPLVGDYELEVHSVNITIVPSPETSHLKATDNASGSTPLASSTILAQDFLHEQSQASDLLPPMKEEAQQLIGDSVASPTIISRIIDRIVDNLKVTITQLNIKVVCAPSLPSLNLLVPAISIANEEPLREEEHINTSESRTKKLLISGLEVDLGPAISHDSPTSSSASSTSSRQYVSAMEQSIYLDATEDLASTMASMLMQQPSSVRRIASFLDSPILATIKLSSSPLHRSTRSARDVYSTAAHITQNVKVDLGNACVCLGRKDVLDLSHILSMLASSTSNKTKGKVKNNKALHSSVSTIRTTATDGAADNLELPGMYRSIILHPAIGPESSSSTGSGLPPEQLSILNPVDALKVQVQLSSLAIVIFYDDTSIDRNSFLQNNFLHRPVNPPPYLYSEAKSLSFALAIDYQDSKPNSVSFNMGSIALTERSNETNTTILQWGSPRSAVHSDIEDTPALSLTILLEDSRIDTDVAVQDIAISLNLALMHRLYALFASIQSPSSTLSSVQITQSPILSSESQELLDSLDDDADEDLADSRSLPLSRFGIVCPSINLCFSTSDSSQLQIRLHQVALQRDQSSQLTAASVREVTAHFEQAGTSFRVLALRGKDDENALHLQVGPDAANVQCQTCNLHINSSVCRTIQAFANDAGSITSPSDSSLSQSPATTTSSPTTLNFLTSGKMKSCVVELDMGSSVAVLSLTDIDMENMPARLPSIQLMVGSIHGTMQMGEQTYVFVSSMELRSHTNTKVLELKVIQQNLQERVVQAQLENLNVYYHQEQSPAWITGLASLLQVPNVPEDSAKKQPVNVDNDGRSAPNLITEILISDCSVRIIPQGLKTRAVLLLQYAEIEISPGERQVDVRGSAASIFGFVIDDTANQKHSDASKTRQDALNYWQACGYIPMLSIKDGSIAACIVNDPILDIQISLAARKVQFDACADSLQTFLATISAIVPVQEGLPGAGNDEHEQISINTSDYTFDEEVFRSDARFTTGRDVAKDVNNISFVEGFFSVDHASVRNDYVLDDHDAEDTVKTLDAEPLDFVDDYFHKEKGAIAESFHAGEGGIVVSVTVGSIILHLYDGYDWAATRGKISAEIVKVRQKALLQQQITEASAKQPNGNSDDDRSDDEVSSCLFKSIYVSVPIANAEQDERRLEADLDHIINEAPEGSENVKVASRPILGRSSVHKIRIQCHKTNARYFISDTSETVHQLASHLEVFLNRLDIIDNLHTSTWHNFLSPMREDKKNVRETSSSMAHIDLQNVRPTRNLGVEEARLFAHIQPVRLHVDQDALEFLKRFFAFKAESNEDATNAVASVPSPAATQAYIQHVKIKAIRVKLDYKPKFVDYKALRGGQTTEVMNFFHFDSAMMTLKEVVMSGVVGWAKMFDDLNDVWMPDIKATQLKDVISGVSPIRSVVNIGSGMADLVLLPMEHYKRDGHVLRGIHKGTRSFAKATTMEAIKLGTKLAAGTQVILEKAEDILSVEGDKTSIKHVNFDGDGADREVEVGAFSKMADPPLTLVQGVQGAYQALSTNVSGAAHTIFAVPVETYQRSGPQGSLKAVVRAVPVAVIKPMIGASEAVTKTLLGLKNSMDPEERMNGEEKYKSRGL